MKLTSSSIVCHRPDGLEVTIRQSNQRIFVCHRPDGLEDTGHRTNDFE